MAITSGNIPSGTWGLTTSIVATPPAMVFAAATDQWMPVFAGIAAGIAGFCWWVYCFPQNQAVRQLVELRLDFDTREKNFMGRIDAAEVDRGKLLQEINRLNMVNARLMGRLGIESPDPDAEVQKDANP